MEKINEEVIKEQIEVLQKIIKDSKELIKKRREILRENKFANDYFTKGNAYKYLKHCGFDPKNYGPFEGRFYLRHIIPIIRIGLKKRYKKKDLDDFLLKLETHDLVDDVRGRMILIKKSCPLNVIASEKIPSTYNHF